MATHATYDDANLILRLFELRREEKLRAARDWFGMNFAAATAEELTQLLPQGSQENTYFRMVIGYWDMAASFVTSGVLNQELFLQSSGELLFVWERVRELVPSMREMYKNPEAFKNLETVGNAAIERMKSKAPEGYPRFQELVRSIVAKPKTSAAR
jgi:hypothetical protein